MKSINREIPAAATANGVPGAEDEPLVSVICFCKDRVATIRRGIESVLNQSYRNFELVVQDGASTDGTLEILRGYDDPRIKLVSEPDSGPGDAFWRVLNRCQGEIIGTCLSDEELLPDALGKAVEIFRANPKLGAATCDGYVTDPAGKITGKFIAGEFDLVNYLFGRYCPFWPGTFIRRQALVDVGLEYHQWAIGCLEFDIWCRLGTQHNVKYFPILMSKYAIDGGQLSNTPKSFNAHMENRIRVIERMFSEDGFAGPDHLKKIACIYNQYFLYYNHARAYKLFDQMEAIYYRMMALVKQLGPLERTEFYTTFSIPEEDQALVQGKITLIWEHLATMVPRPVRNALSRELKKTVREAVMRVFLWLFIYVLPPRLYFKKKKGRKRNEAIRRAAIHGLSAPPVPKVYYQDFANLYYARGQIQQALEMWERAQDLNDPMIDAQACQAMLLLPAASYAGLHKMQARWVQKYIGSHAAGREHAWRPYGGDRRCCMDHSMTAAQLLQRWPNCQIRIGYHCSFMDGDTIRFIMSAVIRRHDRASFNVFGYSLAGLPADINEAFDTVRATRGLSDEQFADLIRADEIDILVEMSGFSPFNRFGAMALRCAPIQISYLNHTGTSAVPNVDYIFADEISVLHDEDRYFTEKVWRLPGAFLCYNYDMVELPPIVPPPSRVHGFVTFGCFGSGGKINDELIAIWANILTRVPRSRIYLRSHQLTPRDNRQFMLDRFRRHGIQAERIKLDGGATRDEIVRSYDNVDISLDTWPYCGGNTLAESLWQGVPVVTLKGARFSSRYGASLLLAAGCAELIGETADRYIEIAVELANSPERLDHYRKNLRSMAHEFGLSDAARFARKLDEAYLSMMQKHRSSLQIAEKV